MPTTLSQPGALRLPPLDLLRDLLRRVYAGIRAADDIEGSPLDFWPEGRGGVFDDSHAVLAIHATGGSGEHADIRHGAREDQMGHAAGPERVVERGAVEAIVVALGDDQL